MGPSKLGPRDDYAVLLPIISEGQTLEVEISGLNQAFTKIIEVNLMEVRY